MAHLKPFLNVLKPLHRFAHAEQAALHFEPLGKLHTQWLTGDNAA
jgi:hypothetical protein